MRRTILQAVLLGLILAVTIPPFALFCRGRSPSRFEQANLPSWERKPPHALPMRAALRASPLPPNVLFWMDNARLRPLREADENRLMAGLETSDPRTSARAGDAGQWLEAACATGRQEPRLAAMQDRVALRLMNAQDSDGYLAAGHGSARWSAPQASVFSHNLRGLLAYYALSHHPAAIYTAINAGNLVVSTPLLTSHGYHSGASLVLPMARLYLLTGETRYRQWAMRMAHAGQIDGAGWCEMYLATSKIVCLRKAQAQWVRDAHKGRKSPELAGALLAITGAPGYAKVLRAFPAPWPCAVAPGTLACTRSGNRLCVNTVCGWRIAWQGARLTQKAIPGTGTVLLTVAAARPATFTLAFPALPAGTKAMVNSKLQPIRQGQLVLTRQWKNGDQVRLLSASLLKPAAPHSGAKALPAQKRRPGMMPGL